MDRIHHTDISTPRLTGPEAAPANVRQLRAAAPSVPPGQIPGELTAAFLTFVRLLNERTTGAPELEVIVRQRHTGETAGTVEVTEDAAIAILAAITSTVNVRPVTHPATGTDQAAEPETRHDRPAWIPDPASTACATRRLQNILAPTRPLRLITGEAGQ